MKRSTCIGFCAGVLAFVLTHPACAAQYDLLITNGLVYDGSGAKPYVADIGINGDRIAKIGQLQADTAREVIEARGLSVAPGFINMLSWATESLLIDGSSQSNIRQGVTLEVFGEGNSMGPLNPAMKARLDKRLEAWNVDVSWTTLGEYLDHLVASGVSPNVASFVGATTVRVHELGMHDRAPTPDELQRMQYLVAEAMREGALGIGSALIYAPGFYAGTDELVALTRTAGSYGGMYISHMRSEGNQLLRAIEELISIAERAATRAEIYHLKVGGRDNWPKFSQAVAIIEDARARGLPISANMYTYTAGSTGLDAAMPPWSQEGGYASWKARLQDPQTRNRIAQAMVTPSDDWENLLLAAGPENVLLVGFHNPELRQYAGRTLADVARSNNTRPVEMAMDLVIADGSRVQAVYFLMSEANVAATVALPWVSFGSDAASIANEGVFLQRSTHPRTYGNFARLLSKYVREEQVLSMAEAIRKLTRLPATNLRIRDRGELQPGYFADVVVFDPRRIAEHATYKNPHQYSTGMVHVFVNGEQVLRDGNHTGRLPGRVVRGPGWQGHRTDVGRHVQAQ